MPVKNSLDYERVWVDALNRGNVSAVDEVFARDCVIHITGQAEPFRGTAGWKQFLGVFLTAFPDLRFELEDQVAEGDKVAHRWSATGTHTGPLGPVPPTGKKVRIGGLIIDRVVDGKVQERWEQYDGTLMMQQLGLA